jgi:hypothetical protein
MDAGSEMAAVHCMKTWSKFVLLVGLIGSMGLTHTASATSSLMATIDWNLSLDPTVIGYAIYYNAAGSTVTNRLDVGLTTEVVVSGLKASTAYSFYAVSYDLSQTESLPSNLQIYTTPPISPLRLTPPVNGSMTLSFCVAPGTSCHVEYTDSLSPPNWTMLNTAVGDSNGLVTISDTVDPSKPSRFYRGVIP